ncbi:hypothetical protein AB5J49_25885 [Streptomyces sp. R28]|uniref:Uncharacterized protein n=1 Tax=Streptomyces sp. R28 TaxID=3238628 RepID=A0AB39Q0L1_9ACTN
MDRRRGADGESPARHAAVMAGALAGLSLAHGAYPVVIAGTPP